ncbi:hypothetical protein [Clostridium ljungdahlii]|uniref:Uncharacterized protein n=1 Tax=Clostridium ljungdahlii TaxID=1538 RepID=A0A166S0S7_9CLOT|nr:hypothetical protein [Clostridium ljungdahlii]OAA91460.1 hypothetical protein WY13_00717 [Clostridium ljungdahlii]
MSKITVIDSIMGTGKTSWTIQHMGEAPLLEKFIYITPFLSEVERVKTSLPDMNFKDPTVKNRKGSKLEGLKQLLSRGENIVSTHALFKRCDEEVIELLQKMRYTLILDEVVEVVEKFDIVKEDIRILFDSKTIIEDGKRWIKWVGTDRSYDGGLKNVMEQCFCNNLYHYGENFYLWTFPIEVFQQFEEVFVLTYMFDGSLQKYYFDIFDVKYIYKAVERSTNNKYKLVEYTGIDDLTKISELLHIYEGKLNTCGNGEYTFSATDMKKLVKKPVQLKAIQSNVYNFFRNITKTSAEENMWTTFKDCQNSLKGKGYTKGFVAVNSRATNEFRERTSMAYIANRFTQPYIKQFFKAHDIEINEDKLALAELLQWIWRSAIREGKEVQLYIPSERMRMLLKDWLS